MLLNRPTYTRIIFVYLIGLPIGNITYQADDFIVKQQLMKQDNYNCFILQKPVLDAGFSLSTRNLRPALSLLLGYYYATITLLCTAFSHAFPCLLPASSYGVTYALSTVPVQVS